MRVLHLSYEIYPVVGGVSTVIPILLQGFSHEDCKVDLITKTIDTNIPHSIDFFGSTIHTILCDEPEGINKQQEIRNQILFHRKINELLKKGIQYDLIHVHDALPIDVVLLLKKKVKAPVLISYHIVHHILRRYSELNNDSDLMKNKKAVELEQKAAKTGDYFHAASNATHKWLTNIYNIDKKNIRIIPYGLIYDNYKFDNFNKINFRRKLAQDDQKIILYAGRFVPQKGINFLVEAFHEIVKEYEKIKLVLIGEGYLHEQIEASLRSLGADHYLFHPKVPFEQLPPFFNSVDVVVMPSIFEPFGMVSIEGMASGAAMVISDIDGLSDIVRDQYNCLTIPVQEHKNGNRSIDPTNLKESILRLIIDNSLNQRLRKSAAQYVRSHFTAKNWSHNMYQFYQDIIKQF